MTTQKLTPKEKKVVNCLTNGNTIIEHSVYNVSYTSSNGEEFTYNTIQNMLDKGILRVKRERFSGVAMTQKTIVLVSDNKVDLKLGEFTTITGTPKTSK